MSRSFAQENCAALADIKVSRAAHLELLNALRKRQDVGTLVPNIKLDQVAQDYACVLAASGHFDHIGPNGSTLATRAKTGGYQYCILAENIAHGQQNLVEAMKGWITSPGHWKNLKNADVTEIGFGVAYQILAPGGPAKQKPSLSEFASRLNGETLPEKPIWRDYYWVQVFGRPCEN